MIVLPQKKHTDRNQYDKYLTPYSLTQQLLESISLNKDIAILEPCSSVEGSIVKVLRDNGYTNVTENVFFPDKPETDIFNLPDTCCDTIITNTPYGSDIIPFVQKMKRLATRQIIALYPMSTLHSTKRYKALWNDNTYKLKQILMFVRPPWLKDTVQANGKYDTGLNAYGWFIWENGYTGDPTLKLIDNSMYCNKKSDSPK